MDTKLIPKIQLSVIIPCFNVAKTIAIQLEALAKQEWSEPWEVIIADNGSTDNTVEIVAQYSDRLPNLKIVDAGAKRGSSYARNVGIVAARGDIFVFCDGDDEIAPGWLTAMGNALSKYDFVSGASEFEKLNEPWRVQKQGAKQKELSGTQQEPPFFPWGNGGNFGFTRLVIDTVGNFDESTTFTQDMEFSWRAQKAGFKLHFIPNATVHYRLRHGLIANYIQARNWAKYGVAVRNKYGLLKGDFVKLRLLLGGWRYLLLLLAKTRTKEDWVIWMRTFGGRIGEIQSIKYL